MLDLRNQKRTSRKLSKFCVHPALQRAAVAHSREMSDRDYLSSRLPLWKGILGPCDMLGLQEANGRREHSVGLGAFRLAGAIFESWMNSSGHKANILNGEFEEMRRLA